MQKAKEVLIVIRSSRRKKRKKENIQQYQCEFNINKV